MELNEFLKSMVEAGGSDAHLKVGMPPGVRVHGVLMPQGDERLRPQQTEEIARILLDEDQWKMFEERGDMDCSYSVAGVARFRVNVMRQRGSISIVLRNIPAKIPSFDDLGLPDICKTLAAKPRGLVLVTGPTGSGKSTTLAAMIDLINATMHGHILTMEDPIEFVHESKRCLMNQREVHRDTLGFSEALRSALREDPDVILVGEMRDLETIRLALTGAETGHLVFGTLHTSSAAKTIDRVVDVFPAAEKEMVRAMLSESLRAVISQTLLKRIGGGRIAAHEIMIGTPAIRNLIREGKIAQMYSAIQTGQQNGMQTLDQCLKELLQKGLITKEEARYRAQNKEDF